MKIETKPGVFQITSKKTGATLATGAAYNCRAKSETTFNALARNMHPDKILRRACSEHGIGDLSFEVLEHCEADELAGALKKHLSGAAKSNAPAERPVKQIDLEKGKPVKEWPSAAVAAVELGLRQDRIEAVCKGKGNSHGGFKWEFSGRKKPARKPAAEKPAEKPADPGADFR